MPQNTFILSDFFFQLWHRICNKNKKDAFGIGEPFEIGKFGTKSSKFNVKNHIYTAILRYNVTQILFSLRYIDVTLYRSRFVFTIFCLKYILSCEI